MPAFDTPEPITLDVDIYAGRVQINASDRADTVVEVRPSDPSTEASVQAAERTIVEFSGGRLLVKGPKPKGLAYLRAWRGSVEVTVDLPADPASRPRPPRTSSPPARSAVPSCTARPVTCVWRRPVRWRPRPPSATSPWTG